MLLATLPAMSQEWINKFYMDEPVDFMEEWIEKHCTERCKEMLRSEYEATYDTERENPGYASWLLTGYFEGEDAVLYLSSVEKLADAGSFSERKAIHIDVFAPDNMQPAFQRTLILDLVENEDCTLIDSVEYICDKDGDKVQTLLDRKEYRLPKNIEEMDNRAEERYDYHLFNECDEEEYQGAYCMNIVRNTTEPGIGQTAQYIQMHGAPVDSDENGSNGVLQRVNIQTYYPQAESMGTTYTCIVYDKNENEATPLKHYSFRYINIDEKRLILEQTFYFSPDGKVIHAERHLLDGKGKEKAIKANIPVSDGTREHQEAIRINSSFNSLMQK